MQTTLSTSSAQSSSAMQELWKAYNSGISPDEIVLKIYRLFTEKYTQFTVKDREELRNLGRHVEEISVSDFFCSNRDHLAFKISALIAVLRHSPDIIFDAEKLRQQIENPTHPIFFRTLKRELEHLITLSGGKDSGVKNLDCVRLLRPLDRNKLDNEALLLFVRTCPHLQNLKMYENEKMRGKYENGEVSATLR